MGQTTDPIPTGAEAGKFAAGRAAADLVTDGMRLGLGTGSTAVWLVRCIADRVAREGLDLTCAATSERTATLAAALGLRVVDLDAAGPLDLTIDGADEFDPALRLIKGGGGAHLREKIVAAASSRMVVITDPSKEVARLGAFPLPVEVVPFGPETTRRGIAAVLGSLGHDGAPITPRQGADGTATRTDCGNLLFDLHLGGIDDPAALSDALLRVPGVVETGLFLDICDAVLIGHPDGATETVTADGARQAGRVDPAGAQALPALP